MYTIPLKRQRKDLITNPLQTDRFKTFGFKYLDFEILFM